MPRHNRQHQFPIMLLDLGLLLRGCKFYRISDNSFFRFSFHFFLFVVEISRRKGLHSFDLRDDFGMTIWLHHFHTGASNYLVRMDSCSWSLCHARGWRCGGVRHILPKFRSPAVQTESAIQGRVGIIHALGRVFLDRLGEGVEQTPAGRFCKFLMGGILELLEDRHNIT